MPAFRALDKGLNAAAAGAPAAAMRAAALAALALPPARNALAVQRQILNQLGSFSTSVQTRLEGSAVVDSSLGGGSIDVQVQRALAQVVRGGAGYGGPLVGSTSTLGNGLPPDQDVLRREIAAVVETLVPIVSQLQPLVPNAAPPSDIEAYRAVVIQELQAVAAEVARVDGPRASLVRVLMGGLIFWPDGGAGAVVVPQIGDVDRLVNLLLLGVPAVPTAAFDEQTASVAQVLQGRLDILGSWNRFAGALPERELWPVARANNRVPVGGPGNTFSDRLIRASELARGIAEDVPAVIGALEAIGYGFAEQQTIEFHVNSSADVDLGDPVALRRVTVADLLDWAAALGSSVSSVMTVSGQLGLNLLADQADELFWLIRGIYDVVPAPPAVPRPADLTDVQVRRQMVNLARDLDALAEQVSPQ